MSYLMAALTADEEWDGVSKCVLRCEHGHRWGAWPESAGTRCVAEVEGGVCGSVLSEEAR